MNSACVGLGLGACEAPSDSSAGSHFACHIPSGLRGMKSTLERNSATNLVKGGLGEPWRAIHQVQRCGSVCTHWPGTVSSDVVEWEKRLRSDLVWHHFCLPKALSQNSALYFQQVHVCVRLHRKRPGSLYTKLISRFGERVRIGVGRFKGSVGLICNTWSFFFYHVSFPSFIFFSLNIFPLTILRCNWGKTNHIYFACTIWSVLIHAYISKTITPVRITDISSIPESTSLPLSSPFPGQHWPVLYHYRLVCKLKNFL